MQEALAIVQIIIAPILLAVALAVRFAGKSTPLNVVDYARVTDPEALHQWAGARLLVLPATFLVGGLASYSQPALAPLFLGIAILVCLGVAAWLVLGAERFQGAA